MAHLCNSLPTSITRKLLPRSVCDAPSKMRRRSGGRTENGDAVKQVQIVMSSHYPYSFLALAKLLSALALGTMLANGLHSFCTIKRVIFAVSAIVLRDFGEKSYW